MGSQTSKQESSQTNSFIHPNKDLERNDSLNLDDTSQGSSIASSLVENPPVSDPNVVAVTFR